jgi:hypothetical protein
MTKPTWTRTQLRRAIMQETGMEFYRRFPSGSATTAVGTVDSVIDSHLAQSDNFWKNGWIYVVDKQNAGEVRPIIQSESASKTLFLEYDLPYAPAIGDAYEIHQSWNAHEIHGAINQAIQDGSKAFFETVTDETLLLQTDKLSYELSSLVKSPWIVCKMWLETSLSARRGMATSATATSLVDTAMDMSDVTSNWKVSIYAGKGTGQIRSIASLTGTHQINVTAWTTTPDATSRYTIWNPMEQETDWMRLYAVRFDQKEFPTLFYIPQDYYSSLGLRFRLEYIVQPSELTVEGSTTVIPRDYVVNKACAILYGMRVKDARADRQRYTQLEQTYLQKAEKFMSENAFRMPDRTIWQSHQYISPSVDPFNPF